MTTPLRTPEQVNAWLAEQGLSKAEVARRFGVSTSLVYELLGRKRPNRNQRGLRGASHNIAVFLGLKVGKAVATKQANAGRPANPAKATATLAQQGAQA